MLNAKIKYKMTIQDLLKKIMLFLVLSSTATALVSCEDDEGDVDPIEEPEEFVSGDYETTISLVADISENGNASDISINLLGASASENISEYRIIVAKSETEESAMETDASSLSSDRFLSVPNNANIFENIVLDQSQLDFDGDDITNGVSYRVWILTVGTFENEDVFVLSEPSAAFTLERKALVTTLVSSIDSNDALTIDSEGNIYASEFGTWTANGGLGTKILKITPQGTVTDYATDMSGPLGITIDDENNLYVIDGNNGSTGNIVKIAPDGTKTTIATLNGWPAGIVKDADGNLYVSNYNLAVLHKIDSEGNVSVISNDTNLTGCVGIDLDENNNIILGNYNDGSIYSVSQSGVVSTITRIAGLPDLFALGYITYSEGYVYATGIGTNRIYKVDLEGNTEVFAGNGSGATVDGSVDNASFNGPNGIVVDEVNDVMYIQDWGAQALRKIEMLEE